MKLSPLELFELLCLLAALLLLSLALDLLVLTKKLGLVVVAIVALFL